MSIDYYEHMIFTIYNFLAYQLVWFISIYGSVNFHPIIGPLSALFFLIAHFFIVTNKLDDFKFLLIVSTSGFFIEWLILSRFCYDYVSYNSLFIPFWLYGIWCCFSCTLRFSLKPIVNNAWFSIFGGAIFGPLSYYGAERLGAISLYPGFISIFILAIVWSALLFFIHRYLIR